MGHDPCPGLTFKPSGSGCLSPIFYRNIMAILYRVIDLSSTAVNPAERVVQSTSPERAVMETLGVEVVRSGSKQDLRARVYFQHPGQPVSMVRLYAKGAKASI